MPQEPKKWTDIHPDFAKKAQSNNNKIYQQCWEEYSLTYQDAQAWIPVSFTPQDYEQVKQWKNLAFTPSQVLFWLTINGLDLNKDDYQLAAYARYHNYKPNNLNQAELRTEFNTWKEKSKPTTECLDYLYPLEKRNQITSLDISHQNLTGICDLTTFVNLKELYCYNNQLTDLDFAGCPKLVRIDCSGNQLKNLNFLKTLPRPEELEMLSIANNPNLVAKNLDVLKTFTNLKSLDLSNCSNSQLKKGLKGSLKSLENAKQLAKISISRTYINEGLEYLSENCNELTCELDYDYSSVEIAKQLSKFSREGGRYDLKKWRKNKANQVTASVISLERLFVIRGNLKQFVNKWGKGAEDDWFDKQFFVKRKQEEIKDLNELKKLQSPNDPDELKKDRWAIYAVQAFGRGSAVAGAVLTFQDQSAIGGGILGIYPFSELLVSTLSERLKSKENKWNEFLNDADAFSDNFNELLAITKSIKVDKVGKINEKFRDLKRKVNSFLKDYDKDSNKEIDVNELKEKRIELSQALKNKKSKLWEVINAIRELEKIVTDYRQEISDSEIERRDKLIRLFSKDIATAIDNVSKETIIDLWKLISGLNNDEPLSINIPQTADEVINKEMIERFVSDLEEIKIDWNNNELKEAMDNLQKKVTADEQEKSQKKFNDFLDLDPDWGFVDWLKNVKSKDLENFADPQWIKEKITTGEIDLNELRREYQSQKTKETVVEIEDNNFHHVNDTKNILLVGWTGSGKSTLAEVLSGDNKFRNNYRTKFSQKSKEFKYQGNYYSVIDNIGFGDNKLDEREEMLRIGEAINSAPQGLSHVLFVFSGRFSDKEKEGFKKLSALKIPSYLVTLVRTKFDNYYSEEECEKDRNITEWESPEIRKIINNCLGFLHIDNGDEDSRNDSREIVLNHLHDSCEREPFKPKEWENITDLIENYFKEKEKQVLELAVKSEEIEQQIDQLKINTANQVKEKIQGEEIRELIEVVNWNKDY